MIIGLFNSTWGTFPAAVSWVATSQQVRDDASACVNSLGREPSSSYRAFAAANTGITGAAARS